MSQSYWDHPMREILMTVEGYSKWGFDVYRTSFEDDALFQRYIDYIQKAMIRRCEADEAGDVASAATLYPKEEQCGKHLGNLLLDEVRKLHMEWVAAVKGDNPHGNVPIEPARRDYFMLVNDEVLKRFRVAEEKLAKENREPEYCDEGVVAIVCLCYEPEDDDDDDDELACRMWQYVWADAISELYNMLCDESEWWITAFARPPEVYGTYN
ncbi:hypothetical protein PG993_014472 [Apiospora rasikravindrae]|uniref:Uncharacterized protein n=1 Tax=Apiospora rasikravindrae TaxID=990691 RepID=A0ABR1RMX7_9PEZI